jgi:hypothetical protein
MAFQLVSLLIVLLVPYASQADTQAGSCKDILHGFLSGQLSSALGDYQIGALKQEFQRFKNSMERSINVLKEQMRADIQKKGL